MTSAAYRYSITAVPGGLITFILLLFMVALIFTGKKAPLETSEVPLTHIFHVDTPPTAFPKPEKPEKVVDAKKQPEIERQPITVDGPTINTPGNGIMFEKGPIDIHTQPATSPYIPLYVPQPRYPEKAIRRGISGYAVVNLTITSAGSVKNPGIVEEYPEGYGFGKAALKAADRLRYNPKVVDGKPVEVNGVVYKFSFSMEK